MQSHFVVVYDHNTGKFYVDLDTTVARFQDGEIFTNDGNWITPESDSELDEENQDAYIVLKDILDGWNNIVIE